MGDQALRFLEGCSEQQPFCLSVSFKASHVQDQDPRQYLYDLEHDPRETRNLATDEAHRERLDHFRARRQAWREGLKPWQDGPPEGVPL